MLLTTFYVERTAFFQKSRRIFTQNHGLLIMTQNQFSYYNYKTLNKGDNFQVILITKLIQLQVCFQYNSIEKTLLFCETLTNFH